MKIRYTEVPGEPPTLEVEMEHEGKRDDIKAINDSHGSIDDFFAAVAHARSRLPVTSANGSVVACPCCKEPLRVAGEFGRYVLAKHGPSPTPPPQAAEGPAPVPAVAEKPGGKVVAGPATAVGPSRNTSRNFTEPPRAR